MLSLVCTIKRFMGKFTMLGYLSWQAISLQSQGSEHDFKGIWLMYHLLKDCTSDVISAIFTWYSDTHSFRSRREYHYTKSLWRVWPFRGYLDCFLWNKGQTSIRIAWGKRFPPLMDTTRSTRGITSVLLAFAGRGMRGSS